METEGRIQSVNRTAGVSWQYVATTAANLSTFTVGAMLGTAVYHHIDVRNKIGKSNYTFLLLVTFVGVMLGLLHSHFSGERHGRRLTLCMSAIPLTLSCGLIASIDNYVCLMIAYFYGGFGSSMCLFTVPIYVSEISCDDRRGKFGSIRMIFMAIGFAIGCGIASAHTLQEAAFVIMFFPLMSVIALHWIPESPVWLARKSRTDEATTSLMWLRNDDQQCVHYELSRIKETGQTMTNSGPCVGRNELAAIRDFFKDQGKRRGFVIASGLLSAQSLWEVTMGLHVRGWLYTGGDPVAASHMLSTIIFQIVVQILGSSAAAMMVDCLGRKRLLMLSCVGMSLFSEIYVGIGRQSGPVKDEPVFLLLILASISIASYYLGMGTIPSVVAVEVFPREASSLGYMMSLSISWIVVAIILAMTKNSILVGSLITFVLSVCTIWFTYYKVPKTRGRSVESIAIGLRSGFGD